MFFCFPVLTYPVLMVARSVERGGTTRGSFRRRVRRGM